MIFDRNELDLLNDTDKAYHQVSDMERLAEMIIYLSDTLNNYGYTNTIKTYLAVRLQDNAGYRLLDNAGYILLVARDQWLDLDYTEVTLERLRLGIKALINLFVVWGTTPNLPDDLDFMTIYKANDIERILYDINDLLERMIGEFIYSSEIYAGEDDFV